MSRADTLANALVDWCQIRGVEAGVREWFAYVEDNNETHLLEAISKTLKNKARQQEAHESVQITAAQHLSGQSQAHLENFFDTQEIDAQTDDSLIAGIKAKQSGRKISANFQEQLHNLSANL